MGEPRYSQIEANAMLAAEKYATYESLAYEITGRVNPGYEGAEFSAESDADLGIDYKVLIHRTAELSAYSITLEGSMNERGMQAICRYETHPSLHDHAECPHCSAPTEILPNVLHVHRYNYAAERDGFGWDKCAEIVDIPLDLDRRLQLRDLIGIFIREQRIHFSDSQTISGFFGTGSR